MKLDFDIGILLVVGLVAMGAFVLSLIERQTLKHRGSLPGRSDDPAPVSAH